MKAFLIRASPDDVDAVIAALHERETAGIEEKSDGLVAYFEDDALTVDELRALLGIAVEETEIPDVDWVARFRENFRAFAVGGFSIAPVWDPTFDPPPGQQLLVVDPGRAFGTGTHESTALCLRALEEVARRTPLGRVLDVGTGSGILAIAARRLGASSVAAADNDPEAITSAFEHARLNHVSIALALADGGRPFRRALFDTVIANITGPLLISRASELAALPTPSGRLVLAGLLAEELPDVRAAYASFPVAHEAVKGEWGSLILERS